jgi:hypothetical protein
LLDHVDQALVAGGWAMMTPARFWSLIAVRISRGSGSRSPWFVLSGRTRPPPALLQMRRPRARLRGLERRDARHQPVPQAPGEGGYGNDAAMRARQDGSAVPAQAAQLARLRSWSFT